MFTPTTKSTIIGSNGIEIMDGMSQKITNKEISWLSFNSRLLQEASYREVPLIERIKFLGIFSSNLDEFFRIRVATLKRLSMLGGKARKLIGHDPKKALKQIQDIVLEQHRIFDKIYQNILIELADENIFIINEKQLSEQQGEFVKNHIHDEVRPKLFPIMLDQIKTIPDLKDHSIYLAIRLSRKDDPKADNHALIEVPTGLLSRFLMLPQIEEKRYLILLDDVIRYSLEDIFSVFKFDKFQAWTVKLTRDAQLDLVSDVSQSYIKKIVRSLRRRKEGSPVRFVYDASIPQQLLDIFVKKLKLSDDDTLIPGARYHNFKDFIKFPDFGEDRLKYRPIKRLPHRDIKPKKSIMSAMEKKDILLHYPYQSFDYIIDLLREASIDPDVTSIKTTVYRAARDSSIINSLINAAKNGKSIVAVMELQARFDEEANIYWSNRLQEEGATVIYGVPGLKVHSKLCQITRQTKKGTKLYTIFGTGNFNEDTARTYSDHSLFTTDRRLTLEAKKIFDFFESNYKTPSFKHLIVSPFNMRPTILELVQNEIDNALKGKESWIHWKLNNLVDGEMIEKLYEASNAGVKIQLNVRGMFSLVPGVKDQSENIEAIGIIDKFLEHSRVFIFCNNGDPKYFISSADLMRRNLDHRVETTVPIYDPTIQDELQNFVNIQWRDNVKARVLNKDLDNRFRANTSSTKTRAQIDIYDYLRKISIDDSDNEALVKFNGFS